MIGQECIDELADFVGLKAHVAAITERAMRGEIAFEPALRERVALLKGLPADVVDEVIAERITLTPGGRALVATMRAHGALHLPRLRRLHAVHQPHRGDDRLRRGPRQHPRRSRTASSQGPSPSRSSAARPSSPRCSS